MPPTMPVATPMAAHTSRTLVDRRGVRATSSAYLRQGGTGRLGTSALERWQSATASADEQVTLPTPTAGTYLIVANVYSTTAPMTWDMTYANVAPGGEGALTATPNPLSVEQGQATSYELGWSGLAAGIEYLGVVQYGDSAVRTIVSVDTKP